MVSILIFLVEDLTVYSIFDWFLNYCSQFAVLLACCLYLSNMVSQLLRSMITYMLFLFYSKRYWMALYLTLTHKTLSDSDKH